MSANSYEVQPRLRITEEAQPERSAHPVDIRRVLIALVDAAQPLDRLGVALSSLDARWLQQQDLAALAWVRFHHLPDLPPETLASLSRAYYAAVADTELHRRELMTVLQTLERQGCRPVVFKGAALAFMIYPDSACRMMGDLDLWVTDEEMPPARASLEALGYLYGVKPDRPLAWMMRNGGELRMNGSLPGQGLVELHWSVFTGEWLQRTARVDEAGLRQRIKATTIVDQPTFVLAPEDAVLQLAAHTAINHQLSMSALRSLADVVLLARHQPIDWSAIVERARIWRLSAATWLVLKLAIDLLALDEARDAAGQLAPSKLRQWLIGRLMNADVVLRLRDLRLSKRRYLYLLLLIDRKRDVVKLIYRTLWPEAAWLRARYQNRSGAGLRLRHLLNAVRGRI